ncbi:hypothetical protein WICPIJ_002872 [Wickerhamomyces pijperi]|uniref:Uncharacterized protein n=1 Tax=Wickerhamomyces pijperi TaxID=599730 RepID=A0A9P8TNJ4_WICPI|nr:hypothetical protein WICPIJ_002872 [Wickerhamomyces pijperi]
MATLTGNPDVDYVLTIIFSLIQTSITTAIQYIQLFLVTYPDIAGVLFITIGAVLVFLILKNLFRMIYNLIITLIKVVFVSCIVFTGVWIYYRGVENMLSDSKVLVGYAATMDGSYLKAYGGALNALKTNIDAFSQFAKDVIHDEL